MNISNKKPAIFLDRDGTIIKLIPYLQDLNKVELIEGAKEAILKLNSEGYLTIITSNQSGIGRGYYSFIELDLITKKLIHSISPAKFDAIYYAPSSPESSSDFRKPGVGMFNAACLKFKIDLTKSWVVGDNFADFEFAQNIDLPFILVMTGYGKNVLKEKKNIFTSESKFVKKVDNISNAIDLILND